MSDLAMDDWAKGYTKAAQDGRWADDDELEELMDGKRIKITAYLNVEDLATSELDPRDPAGITDAKYEEIADDFRDYRDLEVELVDSPS